MNPSGPTYPPEDLRPLAAGSKSVRVVKFRAGEDGDGVAWRVADTPLGGTIDRSTLQTLEHLWMTRERPADLIEQMVSHLRETTLYGSWLQLAAGGVASWIDRHVVFLDLPQSASAIPWEFLVAALHLKQDRDTVALARGCSSARGSAQVIDTPLRILHLSGAASGPGLIPIDLKKERNLVLQAWHSLSPVDREFISEPVFADADQRIGDALPSLKPHVVWFSGHGRQTETTELLLADGQWATARQYADVVGASSEPPVVAVFWACQSGQVVGSHATGPDLFQAMAESGTTTSLMLQAEIGDDNATHLAKSLISHMALGLPLESAVARARSELRERLMTTPPVDDPVRALDWILPTLWTSADSTVAFRWDSTRIERIRQRHLSRAIIMDGLGAGQLDGDPTQAEKDQADAWTAQGRTWVKESTAADRFGLRRTLLAIGEQKTQPVIWIDLADNGIEGLRRWAERVQPLAYLSKASGTLLADLEGLRSADPVPAWRALCSTREITLAVSDPPDQSVETRDLWQPLLDSDVAQVIITSGRSAPHGSGVAWGAVERVEQDTGVDLPEPSNPDRRRLMNALSLVNRPLSVAHIQIPGVIVGREAYDAVEEIDRILEPTPTGDRQMYAGAKRRLQACLTPDELDQAHADAAGMLAQVSWGSYDIDDCVLQHLVRSSRVADYALDLGADLCIACWSEARPAHVRRIVELVGDRLPERARPAVGWAYLQANDLAAARHWLDMPEPSDGMKERGLRSS